MDIDVWMNDLIDQLKIEFKERLVLVGLQGSRAGANNVKIAISMPWSS